MWIFLHGLYVQTFVFKMIPNDKAEIMTMVPWNVSFLNPELGLFF